MKIVSWNCNGKFRDKYKYIEKLNADIYVIQECEDPSLYNFSKNYIWTYENKNKGLAIFARNNIKLKENNWGKYCLRNFISVNINGEFDLVGVWACSPYIEEYYLYQNINIDKYNKDTIIIGDFNSNKIWDKLHGKRNHTAVVNELSRIGLVSAYHYFYNEEQGLESKNTFYLYRKLDKGYHIDYCFIDKTRIKNFRILSPEDWVKLSDHVPIVIEI